MPNGAEALLTLASSAPPSSALTETSKGPEAIFLLLHRTRDGLCATRSLRRANTLL